MIEVNEMKTLLCDSLSMNFCRIRRRGDPISLQVFFSGLACDARVKLDIFFRRAGIDFGDEHFFNLEEADIAGHFDVDQYRFLRTIFDVNVFDRVGGILVDVSGVWGRVEHHRNAGSSFRHVASIGDENEARFERIDALRSHVANDAFQN